MKLLDLFCGAGGAGQGYHESGFTEIVGIDLHHQPNYPFEFLQADLSDPLQINLAGFDLIHASPPCQRFSSASGKADRTHHLDLLRPWRAKLESLDIPYVIENVEGAPLKNPVKLCGTLFPELRVLRHRVFEANFPIPQPYLMDICDKHPPIHHNNHPNFDPHTSYVTVTGGGTVPTDVSADAMGISWMNQRELSQAIPPAYTRYIGKFAKAYLS